MKLLYVGDPMCSWCYGFGKEMTELVAMHPGLALDIIVGGVRAGATDVLDQAGKEFRLGHWARVEAQSGLPALLLDTDQGIFEVSGGYAHAAQLDQQLQQLLARRGHAA